MKALLHSLLLIGALMLGTGVTQAQTAQHTFVIGTNDFLLDGRTFQIRCGEIHAPRVPPEYWRNRLQMAKAMGLNTVCAYPVSYTHLCASASFSVRGRDGCGGSGCSWASCGVPLSNCPGLSVGCGWAGWVWACSG